jgi:hypothetical protein
MKGLALQQITGPLDAASTHAFLLRHEAYRNLSALLQVMEAMNVSVLELDTFVENGKVILGDLRNRKLSAKRQALVDVPVMLRKPSEVSPASPYGFQELPFHAALLVVCADVMNYRMAGWQDLVSQKHVLKISPRGGVKVVTTAIEGIEPPIYTSFAKADPLIAFSSSDPVLVLPSGAWYEITNPDQARALQELSKVAVLGIMKLLESVKVDPNKLRLFAFLQRSGSDIVAGAMVMAQGVVEKPKYDGWVVGYKAKEAIPEFTVQVDALLTHMKLHLARPSENDAAA